MAVRRSRHLEHEILTLVLKESDHLGYATTLPALANFFRRTVPDVSDRELVASIKRLQLKCITIHKWSKEHGRHIDYPAEITDDAAVFYRADFRLRPTPDAYPYLEELCATLHPREPAAVNTMIEERGEPSKLALIADERIAELQTLVCSQFDFRKLIRICEELNTAYGESCYYATAMLIRGLLDHVPPLFGKATFSEVANNYAGGGKSFRDAMHHLEGAARKVADAHLHMPIRKSETLPAAQQVNFAPQLDVLLSEIVRITK